MTRFQLIRDNRIFELDESKIEICDDKDEVNSFSVKEIINLFSELKESNYSDIDIFVDIYNILDNLIKNNKIDYDELSDLYTEKILKFGKFSKYLIKIH